MPAGIELQHPIRFALLLGAVLFFCFLYDIIRSLIDWLR